MQLLHQQAMFANVRKVVMEHDKDGCAACSVPLRQWLQSAPST